MSPSDFRRQLVEDPTAKIILAIVGSAATVVVAVFLVVLADARSLGELQASVIALGAKIDESIRSDTRAMDDLRTIVAQQGRQIDSEDRQIAVIQQALHTHITHDDDLAKEEREEHRSESLKSILRGDPAKASTPAPGR